MAKTIVIVGGEGLVGSSLAGRLLTDRHEVISADLIKHRNRHVKDTFFSFVKLDISQESSLKSFYSYLQGLKKTIDAIIFAAYPRSKEWGKTIEDISFEYLKEDISNHLGGAIMIAKYSLELFRKQGQGNLIFLSSIQGVCPPKFHHYEGTSLTCPVEYCAIKSGIISIVKYLAKYTKGENMRFNAISPGGIFDNQPELFVSNYQRDCIQKGLLEVADLHAAFLFLIDDSSRYFNGQNLIIDDGWTL